MALELCDLIATRTENGEVRVRVGNQASGEGWGSDVSVWSSGDGFLSSPAPPDANGNVALGVLLTIGNAKVVIASRDTRYQSKGGTLAAGDRAIVSNCDAALFLSQSSNTITIKSTGVSVEVNGTTGEVKIANDSSIVTVNATTAKIERSQSVVEVSDARAIMRFGTFIPGVSPAIYVDATGVHFQGGVAPTFNGVPMMVP